MAPIQGVSGGSDDKEASSCSLVDIGQLISRDVSSVDVSPSRIHALWRHQEILV
jgi:hypothetical protein